MIGVDITVPPLPCADDERTRVACQRAVRRLQRAQLAEARRIRQAVADGYTLTPAQLTSPCRVAERAEARQGAMWLMRTRLTWPLPTRDRAFPCDRIGRVLGGRDHATVLHGVAVIAARLVSGRQEDASLRHMVRALGATLDATYEAAGLPPQRATSRERMRCSGRG